MRALAIPQRVRLGALARDIARLSRDRAGVRDSSPRRSPTGRRSHCAPARARAPPPRSSIAVGHELKTSGAGSSSAPTSHPARLVETAHRRPLDVPLDDDAVRAPAPRCASISTRWRRRREREDVDVVRAGHGEPVTDHVTLIDERLPDARPARRQDPRAAWDGPKTATRSPGAVGHRRGQPGLPHDLRGAGQRDLLVADGRVIEEPPATTASCAFRATDRRPVAARFRGPCSAS